MMNEFTQMLPDVPSITEFHRVSRCHRLTVINKCLRNITGALCKCVTLLKTWWMWNVLTSLVPGVWQCMSNTQIHPPPATSSLMCLLRWSNSPIQHTSIMGGGGFDCLPLGDYNKHFCFSKLKHSCRNLIASSRAAERLQTSIGAGLNSQDWEAAGKW